MAGIMTIFGVIWIFNGVRYFFFTEKFSVNMKNILEEDRLEYTKGMGKFQIGIGICFLLFDKAIPSLVGSKYSFLLLIAVVLAVLFYFNQWNRNYTNKKSELEQNQSPHMECEETEKKQQQ